jgi:hypothetical protein
MHGLLLNAHCRIVPLLLLQIIIISPYLIFVLDLYSKRHKTCGKFECGGMSLNETHINRDVFLRKKNVEECGRYDTSTN